MNMSKPYGLTQWECIELSRVALRDHVWPVSRMLAIAVKMLRNLSPGLKLVISYADTLQNHHGGIYQAAGWIYCGVTGGDTEYWIGNRWSKARNFRSADWSKFSGIDYSKLKSRKTPGKHRYLMPLDPEMRARIAPLAKPYPKRAGSIAGDAPATHAGQGGSTPTPALSSLLSVKNGKITECG